MEGFTQIWDRYVWLTPSHGSLNIPAPLCWEQRNHSKQNLPNYTLKMGWIPTESCQNTIIRKKVIGLGQTGLEDQVSIGWVLMELTGYVEQTSGLGCHQDR